MLHGELMLRAVPELRFRPVAAGAGLAADEGGCRRGGRAAGGCRAPAGQELKCQAARDDGRRRDDRRDDGSPPRNAPPLPIALPCARLTDLAAARPLFPTCVASRNSVWNGPRSSDHRRLYIRSAAASARVHPARFPCASSRLARAKVAANVACAFRSARLTEAGVGWTSSCAPIDCGAIGPAFGFPADWRTACSNCAIRLLHGPACAVATPRPRTAATSKVAEGRLIARRRIPSISMTCSIERHRAFQGPPIGPCRRGPSADDLRVRVTIRVARRTKD